MNAIKWHNRARKQIKKIPQKYRETIFESIDLLATFPECGRLDIVGLKTMIMAIACGSAATGFSLIMMMLLKSSLFRR